MNDRTNACWTHTLVLCWFTIISDHSLLNTSQQTMFHSVDEGANARKVQQKPLLWCRKRTLTEMTSSAAPLTIWKSCKMKPDGGGPPIFCTSDDVCSASIAIVPSLMVDSILIGIEKCEVGKADERSERPAKSSLALDAGRMCKNDVRRVLIGRDRRPLPKLF